MNFAILDLETTGLNPKESEITEVAVLVVDEYFNEIRSFSTFVQIDGDVPKTITELTGITKDDCDNGMSLQTVSDILYLMLLDTVLVCQNAPFDMSFLSHHCDINPKAFVCTRTLTAFAQPFDSASLKPTCERLGIELNNAHRAMNDVRATAKVLEYWMDRGVYVENTITHSEDRPLGFVPNATKHVMDQSKRRDINFGIKNMEDVVND